jgi:protein-disulfide isomerase
MLLSLLRTTSLLVLAGLSACSGPLPGTRPLAPRATTAAENRDPTARAAERGDAGSAKGGAIETDGPGDERAGAPSGGPMRAPSAMARGLAGPEGGAAAEIAEGDLGPMPVSSADPSWGDRDAPVTLIEFADLQCFFCARAAETLEQLRRDYGPSKLRIVWKSFPLSFHADARMAAETSMALYELGGGAAFWAYHDKVMKDASPARFVDAIKPAGSSIKEVNDVIGHGGIRRKVDEDLALGQRFGVTATPAFFVNGVSLVGAQPIEVFKALIDAELDKAKKLGVAKDKVYVEAWKKNAPALEAQLAASRPSTAWRVPVGSSPVRGSDKAPVTLVLFGDFQCPFCVRVEGTIAQLSQRYGDKLRVVWKNLPLAGHSRAEPAAELALEARAQKGDAGFWKVHDALVAQAGALEATDLEAVAKAAGLDVPKAMRNVAARAHRAAIEEDEELADALGADSTPTAFINGVKLEGAEPLEVFTKTIDERLAVATAALGKGVAPEKLYESLQQRARGPAAPEQRTVPAPTANNPTKGPESAKVTVHVFGDYECPFCSKAEATLNALDASFPGAIRFVWHHNPLAMHPHAQLAAEAAMEAFKQKGAKGFWSMHEKLFAGQKSPQGLERKSLEAYAAEVGLDMAKLAAALDGGTHRAAVQAEAKMAATSQIDGTPCFVINGMYVWGAQPLPHFRRLVRRALADAK